MMFKKRYDGHDHSYSCSGDSSMPEYVLDLNAEGGASLVQSGSYDICEYINSFAEYQTMDAVLERLRRGDFTALRPGGVYADVTGFPETLAGAHALSQQIQQFYYGLPKEIRDAYPTMDAFADAMSSNSKFDKFVGQFDKKDSAASVPPGEVNE